METPWTRALVRVFATTVVAAQLAAGIAARQPEAPPDPATAVTTIGITVADLERACAFYTGVLGFERVDDTEVAGDWYERLHGVFGARARIARLRLGSEEIELTEFLAPRGRSYPTDTRANDRWFQHVAIIVSDMDRAYAHLRQHGVAHASTGPQRLPDWNPNAGGITAYYFRDPDGHFLEVLHFPPGKGDPRWQEAGTRLFLGIDHTAIVSGDTERSLAFYRDTLGLRIVGESENHGVEQEHLNNVFGARLRITTLKATAGPGVELLEYLAPRGGREAPTDLAANDVAHWQTTIALPRIVRSLLRPRGFFLVSPDVIDVPAPHASSLSFARALLVRDPDGHGVRLVQPSAAPR